MNAPTRHNRRLYFFPAFLAAVLRLALQPLPCHAGGPVHGARAAGMGTAFIAVSDDPSAVLHNPAGIDRLPTRQVYGGLSLVSPSSTFTSTTGSQETTDSQYFAVPHLYATRPWAGSPATMGIGIYSPFGIGGRKWDDTGLLRYISTESLMTTLSVSPVLAWRTESGLSIAAAPELMFVRNQQKMKISQATLGATDAHLEIDAEDSGWGLRLGLLYSPSPALSLGLAFRSRVSVDLQGDYSVSRIAAPLQAAGGGEHFATRLSSPVSFPEVYSLGIAFRPTQRLLLACDLEVVRWSSFVSSDIDLEREIPAIGIIDSTTRLDWHDSWQIKAGFEYTLWDNWRIRGGYSHIPTPVPDQSIEAANPDADQDIFSTGLGWRSGRWQTDIYYNLALYAGRPAANRYQTGTYESISHAAGVSIGYDFGGSTTD